ncbi:hypothetical protein WR25_26921 [Diploscapter pachys]|uniref:Uncharacterized protein n=1 Tax=Diploscapter pachys TaxID=2018661 RepID=A0A2A2JUV7_9BILA|nr:hypothetical protein WR25_26921 [Diploscapter pachys]
MTTPVGFISRCRSIGPPYNPKLAVPNPGKSPKWQTAEEAMSAVKSGDSIFIHSHAATPTELLEELCRQAETRDLNGINLHHIILLGNIPWTTPQLAKRIRSNCLFIDGGLRKSVAAGVADYMPIFLQDQPSLFSTGRIPLDVALISVSPPDERGYCSLGVNVDISFGAISHAKRIIALVNDSVPRTYGWSLIHSSNIDSFVKCDRPIYANSQEEKVSEEEQKIGQLIAENLVEDGATLQLGIGAIPDSSLKAMQNHKDLGIHTELAGEQIVNLMKKGVVTNRRKTFLPGKTVASFAFGSREFYDFVDGNEQFYLVGSDFTNNIDVVRENSQMTCINATLEIDLTGQICSDSIGTSFFSGFGGQVDFMTAGPKCHDRQGKAIITLTSRTNKGKSKIVPILSPGAGVVSTRAHAHYIVTEYGIANLWGKNVRQRAYELIKIAHPDDRESLERASFERLKCMPSP